MPPDQRVIIRIYQGNVDEHSVERRFASWEGALHWLNGYDIDFDERVELTLAHHAYRCAAGYCRSQPACPRGVCREA